VGSCMQTAIASILEMPLDQVPNFVDVTGPSWWDLLQSWVLEHCGCQLFSLPPKMSERVVTYAWPGTYCIVSGISPRGLGHVVVGQVKDDYSIEMVHDPHPDGTGLRKITNYYFFVCKDPSKGKQ